MQYTELKQIKTFCDGLFSTPDWREVVENIENRVDDFEVSNVRFINSNEIDQIQQDELESEPYVLGSFSYWFLADILGMDTDIIEAMQESRAFEGLGKLIISRGLVAELQEKYASLDGYGPHFNRYNGDEKEITVDGVTYYVFDNH